MNNKQNNPKMNMPKFNMNWIYGMVIVALLLLWFTGGGQKASVRTETSYSEFKKMVLNGYASKIVVNKDNNTLRMFVKPEHIRDVFGKGVQQTGTDPSVTVEFGSVDQVEQFIDEARLKGAHPVLITPTRRRQFSKDGTIKDTHLDYPAAIRDIAAREKLPLIDLQEMTKVLCETLGPEESKHLYVHYPANTYPGQAKDLKDNTHFNTFGAYEVSKCVIEGMKKAGLPVVKYLRADYQGFDPAHPDKFEDFKWNLSPFTEIEKPDGN